MNLARSPSFLAPYVGKPTRCHLQIELLFNDYNVTGAFAASSTLGLIAVVTLVLKYILELETAS